MCERGPICLGVSVHMHVQMPSNVVQLARILLLWPSAGCMCHKHVYIACSFQQRSQQCFWLHGTLLPYSSNSRFQEGDARPLANCNAPGLITLRCMVVQAGLRMHSYPRPLFQLGNWTRNLEGQACTPDRLPIRGLDFNSLASMHGDAEKVS